MPAHWLALCRALGIPQGDARTWWKALHHARWSRVVSFRQTFAVLCVMPGPLTPERAEHFLRHAGQPTVLMQVLSECVKERVLVAPVARRIEDALLAAMALEVAQNQGVQGDRTRLIRSPRTAG